MKPVLKLGKSMGSDLSTAGENNKPCFTVARKTYHVGGKLMEQYLFSGLHLHLVELNSLLALSRRPLPALSLGDFEPGWPQMP